MEWPDEGRSNGNIKRSEEEGNHHDQAAFWNLKDAYRLPRLDRGFQHGSRFSRIEMVKGVEDRTQAGQCAGNTHGIDRVRPIENAFRVERGVSGKRFGVWILVSQDDGHAQAGSKQGLKDGENRPAAAGAKIDYLRRLRFLKQIVQKRHCRRMELKALLHKLQVVGRKVADGAREPGEILKFEQLQTREAHGLFYLLSCGHLAPIHRGWVSQDEVADALHGPAEDFFVLPGKGNSCSREKARP